MWFWARREINDWRDGWTSAAAALLHEIADQLVEEADRTICAASSRDILVPPGGFVARRVEPGIRAVAEPVMAELLEKAEDALRHILGTRAARLQGGDESRAGKLASSAGTGSTPWFLQVAGEAIRWPAAAVGSAIADVAVATGVLDRPGVREALEKRLRAEASARIRAMLIRGTDGQPALLEQVTAWLHGTAKAAKRL